MTVFPSASKICISWEEDLWSKLEKYLPGSSKANVMGENSSIIDIVVAMNSINAIDHWNPQTTGKRPPLKIIYHIDPICSTGLRKRRASPTTQHTPCAKPLTFLAQSTVHWKTKGGSSPLNADLMQQLQWHKINHIGEVFQTKNTHFHKYLVLKHKYVLKLIKIFTQMGKLIKKKCRSYS